MYELLQISSTKNYCDFFHFYEQLQRLLELKHVCLELALINKDFHIDEETWDKLNDIVEVFKILSDKTVCLQKQNLTMSDSFGIWLEIEARLKLLSKCPLATVMLQIIDKRKGAVLENAVMYSALFLDPRFQFMLSEEQLSIALKHLTYLHQKQNQKSNAIQREFVAPAVERTGDENENFLEKCMQEMESKKKIGQQLKAVPIRDPSLQTELMNFQGIDRLVATANVMTFWSDNRFKFPILNSLARTIFAVPPTEVSVERHFSSLTFILNKYRNKLSDENLEMVLFLKLNKSIFLKSIESTDLLLISNT